jgi:hypothetical protein
MRQRSHASVALKTTARDKTPHLKANASGPCSAPFEVSAMANKTMKRTPKKVPTAPSIHPSPQG